MAACVCCSWIIVCVYQSRKHGRLHIAWGTLTLGVRSEGYQNEISKLKLTKVKTYTSLQYALGLLHLQAPVTSYRTSKHLLKWSNYSNLPPRYGPISDFNSGITDLEFIVGSFLMGIT